MPRLKVGSGASAIKILCKHFGFSLSRRRGSHVVLIKETEDGKVGTVVPDHKELKIPTLRSALKLAKVDENEFANYQ